MKVPFKLKRKIPQWKAILENRPECEEIVVEAEIWEHNTRGLEPLAELFAELKSNGSGSTAPKNDPFILPPEYAKERYTPDWYSAAYLRIELPVLAEDDVAGRVIEECLAVARQAYRDGCSFGKRVAAQVADLPVGAWGVQHTMEGFPREYADPIQTTVFSIEAGLHTVERLLELPTGYLADRLETWNSLCRYRRVQEAADSAKSFYEKRLAELRTIQNKQHHERLEQIEAAKEANRKKFEQLVLAACPDPETVERYNAGYMSREEQKNHARTTLFGKVPAPKFSQLKKGDFCDCGYVNFSDECDFSLTNAEYKKLKQLEEYFKADEFEVKVRNHLAKCQHQATNNPTVLVTWEIPNVDPLSREFILGVANEELD